MWGCNKELNAFQLRSLRLAASMLGLCVAVTSGYSAIFEPNHFSLATRIGIAMLPVIPIIGTMIVIARYLAGEKDEYLRSLVVQSILWGFGIVMVVDTLVGSITEYHPLHIPFGLLNMDIFVVTSMLALRIQLWRNR